MRIVTSVHCDVANAIIELYEKQRSYQALRPIARKMNGWGVQMALTLKTSEKSTFNPGAVWAPVGGIFTLGASANLLSEAVRTNILNFYYLVPQLRARGRCTAGLQPDAPVRSLLIQNDLKFRDWLFDQLAPVATNEITLPDLPGGPLERNVLSHEVSFQVVSTGGISPAWKLDFANYNQSGVFLEATRDRVHTLLITMGPGDGSGLKGAAKDVALSSSIGLSVTNHLQGLRSR